jgi:hypothetical protein
VLHAQPSSLLAVIVAGLATPLRALVVGALGAGIAWCWYNDMRLFSFVAPLAVIVVGLAVSEAGVRQLPGHPVAAVRLMPWRIVVPSAIAAAAAGLVIIATVELTVPDKTAAGAATPTDIKEIAAALSAAVTAFLGAAFIDWAADGKDSRLADWISGVFYEKYADPYFPKESPAREAVFTNVTIEGWGPAARAKRAKLVAKALAAPPASPAAPVS